MRMSEKGRIRILENGPYMVTGNVRLVEMIITPKGMGYEYREGRKLPQAEKYMLCRCGRSKNAPFCDGMHARARFDGAETASRAPYVRRAKVLHGPGIDLLDDGRCAFARFCHRDDGDVWELTLRSGDPWCRDEAIRAACECPTGRLTARTKDGQLIEPEFTPTIEVLQDPERGVSGALFVKGGIEVEAADGQVYEVRNRMALCRCGMSRNKPFCDAAHVNTGFIDE